MADISKITLPTGSTYNIKDAALTAVVGTRTKPSETHETRISNLEGQVQALTAGGLTYKIVEQLPAASEETMGNIYLVAHTDGAAQEYYDEYLTLDNGAGSASSRYTWEHIGNTSMDLDGYAQSGDSITIDDAQAQSSRTGISVTDHTVTQGTTSSDLYYTTDTFVKSYPGVTAKLVTTSITGTNGTVSVPNVTGNEDVTATHMTSMGTLPTLTTTVNDETLSITFSQGTLPQGSDVDASKVTLGTAISAAKAAESATTVATGATASSDASGASIMTGLGTASTSSAMNAVSGSNSTGASKVTISGKNSGIAVSAHSVTDNGHTHAVTGTGTIDE